MNEPAQGERTASATRWHKFVTLRKFPGNFRRGTEHESHIIDAGLPDQPARIVREVCQRARLWRSETRDVAKELCAHFREGLDAGKDPETLARDFGDPHRAALLIRRAKRRQRPLAWKAYAWAVRGSFALIALCLLGYGYAAVRLYSGTPTLARNFAKEYNDALAPTASTHAWPIYRAAYIQGPAYRWPSADWPKHWPDVFPGDAQYVETVAYVRACAPMLAEIRRASALPVIGTTLSDASDSELAAASRRLRGSSEAITPTVGVENPLLIEVLLPHLNILRTNTRVLIFDARLARREGDNARAVANLRAILGMAHQMGDEPFFISELVGYALLTLASQEVCKTLRDAPKTFSDADISALAHDLSRCIAPGRLIPSLRGERWSVEDAVQRIYTDDGNGDGRPTAEGLLLMRKIEGFSIDKAAENYVHLPIVKAARPVLAQLMAGRRETLAEYDRLMLTARAEHEREPWVRRNGPHPALDEINRCSGDTRWQARFPILSIFLPALGSSYWSADAVTLEREAACVALACELFRRRNARWPASLDELVPSLLPAVPRDIFDGMPLRYRVVNGSPVLYSIGSDDTDNAGTPHPDNAFMGGGNKHPTNAPQADWIFWPPPADKPRVP